VAGRLSFRRFLSGDYNPIFQSKYGNKELDSTNGSADDEVRDDRRRAIVAAASNRREEEVAAVLVGYMDESSDGTKLPKVFTLSCLVSDSLMWIHFEWAWQRVLDEKNEDLRRQGRQEIKRFHAQDINNFAEEYKDWNPGERLEFCRMLSHVFERHPVHIHSWDMPLDVLVEEIPESKSNPIGLAYCVLLGKIMQQIGDMTLTLYRGDLISLHHERCDHDASLAEWFNLMLEDETFQFRHRFVSITPERWEFCVPLQPADLVAYETFKEGMRYIQGTKESKRGRMRLSLEALINLDSIGGRASAYSRVTIKNLKKTLDNDPETKQALFKAARIKN
jgi:hypothetical protein